MTELGYEPRSSHTEFCPHSLPQGGCQSTKSLELLPSRNSQTGLATGAWTSGSLFQDRDPAWFSSVSGADIWKTCHEWGAKEENGSGTPAVPSGTQYQLTD